MPLAEYGSRATLPVRIAVHITIHAYIYKSVGEVGLRAAEIKTENSRLVERY
jgi:hypothetical protein